MPLLISIRIEFYNKSIIDNGWQTRQPCRQGHIWHQSQHKTPFITFRGHSRSIRINLIFLETRITDLYFAADSMCLSSFKFSGGLRKTMFSTRVCFARPGSSKVIDFGVNRKHVCDFIYVVHHSYLGHILHRFKRYYRFLRSRSHPYSTLILQVLPLHQIASS